MDLVSPLPIPPSFPPPVAAAGGNGCYMLRRWRRYPTGNERGQLVFGLCNSHSPVRYFRYGFIPIPVALFSPADGVWKVHKV